MKKDLSPFCYLIENNTIIPAILHENQLIETVKILLLRTKKEKEIQKVIEFCSHLQEISHFQLLKLKFLRVKGITLLFNSNLKTISLI